MSREFVCSKCGGTIIGDGYAVVRHCENVDITGMTVEPDAGTIECEDSDDPN
jgi:hypothetical protein